MDKKVGVFILFGFLVIIGLVGLTTASIDSGDSPTDVLRSANMSLYGDGYLIDNSTKGAVSEMVNLTITAGNNVTSGNITNISITWAAAANFTFDGWLGKDDSYQNACTAQGSGLAGECDSATANTTFSNVTITEDGDVGDWSCLNLSAIELNCYNNTAGAELSGSNNSITIRFNLTAGSSIEDREIFTINTSTDSTALDNGTYLTAFVDGTAPRLYELNISDSNTTWENGTFNGSVGSGYASFLSNHSDLTVTATFYEQTPHTGDVMWLFYNGTDYGLNATIVTAHAEVKSPTVTQGPLMGVDGTTYSHPIKYQWTITANSVVDFGTGTNPDFNRTIGFMIETNDTYNNYKMENDSSDVNSVIAPFSIMLNDTLPYIYNISFTDDRGNVLRGGHDTDSANDFLSDTNVTIVFRVAGAPKPSSVNSGNESTINLYYNTTGNVSIATMEQQTNGDIVGFGGLMNLTDTNISAIESNENPLGTVAYETSIDFNGNATNEMEIYIVLGNKTVDQNPDTGYEDLAANYTTMSGPYRFVIDGTDPSATLSTPHVRGISTLDSIEYTCTGTDGESGVEGYKWTLVKPNGDEITYDRVDSITGTNLKTFSGNDIATPGQYGVKCKVYDAVDNEYEVLTSTSNDFTASIQATVGGGAGVGPGGAAAVSFDVDFTTLPQATFKASQGRVKSFSFDGVTKHTITFNEVTADGVTLIIASDPITVKLNTGQSKSVDVNADGTDDMKVQLNSVDNGVADVTVSKLEAGAAKIKAEEEKAREAEAGEEGREVTPVAGRSLAWLWWTLIVIVAIVVIGYYVNKRK